MNNNLLFRLGRFKEANKDIIPGGLADKKSVKVFPPAQIKKGIKTELEHTNSKQVAEEIAKDHLTEDRQYYTKLQKMEKSANDSITADKGLRSRSQAFSDAKSLATRNNLDPRLADTHAKSVASMSSVNPRKNSIIAPMLHDYNLPKDPIQRDDNTTHRITKDATVAELDQHSFHAWKSDPNPQTLGHIMKRLDPIIHKEVNKWAVSGMNPVILKAKAKDFAYQALKTYDPSKNVQLNTHVTNNLRQMSRFVINNQNAIRVPEEHIYGYRNYLKVKDQMEQESGGVVSHLDVKERFAEQGKTLNEFKPMIEHFYSKSSEAGSAPVMEELSSNAVAIGLFFDKLDDTEKFVFKHSYGYQGAMQKSNQQIAQELGVSPAAISKRKNTLEKKYHSIANPLSHFMGA